jgi:acyl carrier protein
LEITSGNSVLVAPAVAVVFLGTPTGRAQDRKANLGVTFDHRLINGVIAANLLAAIVRKVDSFGSEDTAAQNERSIWDSVTVNALQQAELRERRTILEKLITEQVAGMTGAPPLEINPQESLRMLGLSSLMALELTCWLEANLRQSLPATLLWTYPTITALATHLAEATDKPAANIEEPERKTHEVSLRESITLDNIEDLSEEEAEALLKRRVEGSL